MSDVDFEVRVGRIGHRRGRRVQSFVGQVVAATARAGGMAVPSLRRASVYGRGRAQSLAAGQGLGRQARRVVVKARVVRHGAGRAPLGLHLDYLRREGVAPGEAAGRLFDARSEVAAGDDFAARCEGDRHHFRFIVSPEDAEQLADLKGFARDLMAQAERDLGTSLDWVAADHWNTAHPHVHVLVRGKTADGADLVISRDYISRGLRARAARLLTLELGPRSAREQALALEREAGADRWTGLDRQLQNRAGAEGRIDLSVSGQEYDRALSLRLQKLRDLGLADDLGRGCWRLSPDAEPTLRALGRRGDVIARIHQAMGVAKVDPSASPDPDDPAPHGWVGRLVGRGLDDELKGTAYGIVDGIDGTVRHVPLDDLVNAADAPLGAVVEVRRSGADRGAERVQLWVRSDLGLDAQVEARGATWLDRQLVVAQPPALAGSGFGAETRAALARRIDHLMDQGLAQRQGARVVFARDLLATLRDRELADATQTLGRQTGLERVAVAEGRIDGVYRQRLDLASGRFAMIQTEEGFALVPWQPALDRRLGQTIRGQVQAGGGIRWSLDPSRGLGR